MLRSPQELVVRTGPLLAAATCKHLAVYNVEEAHYGGMKWLRHRFQANVTAQELEETYLPAFRACVMEGNAQQIMCSYNSIAVSGGPHPYNSTPACLDGVILNNMMRGDWGFNGSVVSDCDSLSDAHFAHRWAPVVGDGGNASAAETVVAGLEGGCDMDCGKPPRYRWRLRCVGQMIPAIIVSGQAHSTRTMPTSRWRRVC